MRPSFSTRSLPLSLFILPYSTPPRQATSACKVHHRKFIGRTFTKFLVIRVAVLVGGRTEGSLKPGRIMRLHLTVQRRTTTTATTGVVIFARSAYHYRFTFRHVINEFYAVTCWQVGFFEKKIIIIL